MKKECWQILIRGQALRPSGGEPYEFESRLEAAKCVHRLYGNWDGVQVVKVDTNKNKAAK